MKEQLTAKYYIPMEELPCSCLECPFFTKAETIHLGDFVYKRLFTCSMRPDDLEDIYIHDAMSSRPSWCPIKEKKFEGNTLNEHYSKQTKKFIAELPGILKPYGLPDIHITMIAQKIAQVYNNLSVDDVEFIIKHIIDNFSTEEKGELK